MKLKENPPLTSLFTTKKYKLFWISSLLSNMGTWMQQVAQPWVILSISQSAFLVGLDSFALNAPSFIFTFWGGILADRFDRKKIILFFQIIQFFCVLLLFILLVKNQIHIWMIILISFFVGTTDAISMPAFQTIIPSLVKAKDIPRAVALNATQFNLSRILGPALAGLVLVTFGAPACFGINLISYLPFFLSIYWIYPKQRITPKSETQAVLPMQNESQFLHLIKNPKYQGALLTVLITTLFSGSLVTFCSVIIKSTFLGGAQDLGFSTASFGLGGVLGAVLSSIFTSGFFHLKRFPNLVALFIGVALILIAIAPSLLVLNITLFLVGLGLTISNISISSGLQKLATNNVRGRVSSLFQLSMQGGLSIGSLLTGIVSSTLGIKTAMLTNGIALIVSQTFLIIFFKGITVENTLP